MLLSSTRSGSARSGSVTVRSVVLVVSLLVAVTVLAAVAVFVVGHRERGGDTRPDPEPTLRLADAVERTRAAGSARIDATYQPAHGPPIAITGRASLVGPESEFFAAVGDNPPASVRVTGAGAWLRPPGAEVWTPVTPDAIAGAAASRGWADVLGNLDPSSNVRTDARGRIVRVRLARDRAGGTLDIRLSAFGTDVVIVPP